MKIHLLVWFHFSCYHGNEFKLIMTSKAMDTNEIRTFDINLKIRKECKLSPAKYHVKKTFHLNEFTFWASKYEWYPQESSTTPDGIDMILTLGYARCARGYIEMVQVNPKARKCGMAKELSTLCMLDPQINSNFRKYISHVLSQPKSWTNKVLEELEQHQNNNKVDFLKKCFKLIGLFNKAKPYAGAFAYLSAARDTGFQYLVVRRYVSEETLCSAEEFLHYQVNHILTKKLFNGKTGMIGDEKGSGIPGSGYKANWYFCKR